jgi:hypothetical protein
MLLLCDVPTAAQLSDRQNVNVGLDVFVGGVVSAP